MPSPDLGNVVSPFAPPNILFDATSGKTLLDNQTSQNALMQSQQMFPLKMQAAQQDVGNAEMGMASRIAGSLLNMPDEASRAQAYPGMIADARANGFKLANAPDAYPGEATTRALMNRALTVPESYQYGVARPPGLTPEEMRAIYGGNPPGQTGGGGGGGGPDPVAAMPREPALDAIAQRESGNKNVPNAQGGDASGYWQIRNATWQDGAKLAGIDVSKWPRAMDAPWMVQRAVAGALFDKYGATPWLASSPGYRGTQTAQPPGAPQAPQTPSRVALRTGGTDTAGPGAGPAPGAPGGSVPVTGKQTDEAWLANQALSYPGLAGPNDTSQAPVPAPSGGAPGAAAAAPGTSGRETYVRGPNGTVVKAVVPAAPAPPAAPALGGGVMDQGELPGASPPNQLYSPPAPPAAPAAQPPPAQQQAPAPPPAQAPPAQAPPPAAQPPPGQPQAPSQPNLPHYWEVPTGQQSSQFQQARDLENRAAVAAAVAARYPANSPQARQAAAAAADLKQRAEELKATDTVVQTQEGPVHVLTGQRDKPIAPLPHWVQQPDGSWIDTSSGEPKADVRPDVKQTMTGDGLLTTDAKDGHFISLIPATPTSTPRAVNIEGVGTVMLLPGGGSKLIAPINPSGIAKQRAAEAEGTASGTAAAKALPELMDQGRAAQAAEGNIDYGLAQLDRARAGGINTGYFSGALTTAASALKSLGVPTEKIGIDPTAVGDIQTARKTLAVVSGAILQQIVGKSPITDSKIEAYIHAQPGIETDPDAVRRVLAWARSQFTYEREMAQAGVKEAAKPENDGRLPTGWQAGYYAEHGFAPVYNPGTREMEQPDGQAPGRTSPASSQPQYHEGQTATGEGGQKLVYRNGTWGPP